MKAKISPRITLVIIASLFLLPLLLAWFMYSGAIEYKPSSTQNFGRLVEPAVPMAWEDTVLIPGPYVASSGPDQVFSEHWVILYVPQDSCLEACIQEVSALRQIHLASGRHQPRIRIALLIRESGSPKLQDTLHSIYSKFHFIGDPSGKLTVALEQAAAGKVGAYLIDPLGNIMMTYESGADPNHLKQDLKRLLTWSKLDEQ
jgi:hypothetical protein